ncbi:hypothetical protein [Amaricoccus solimangrovi]|uniref:Tetratricopeptide repeat protein n=1 Tax=Amaricoccus solimangrovi TaxID=2589815 RepID=A0A501X0E2_9RHOB|nr:hypothetical protein [Amaricoccus solimangrovi]TPE53827.1 hypothetical protein FJM51_01920 [Amaricoccus solimangrovi]
MPRRLRALLLAAALLPPGAAAAGAAAIRGGEHADFSRLILPVPPGVPFSLRVEGREAILLFPGRALDFDASEALSRLARGRVAAIEAGTTPAGTRVRLTLGCDCAAGAAWAGPRLLALDIAPAEAPVVPPPKSRAAARAARNARESGAVAGAEAALLRQLERAAEQGVVDLDTALPEAAGPEAAPRHRQVEAVSVLDRDRPDQAPKPPPPGCLPAGRFDLGPSTPPADYPSARAAALGGLLSEFDAPDPDALSALVRLDIRLGLGPEALGLLGAFPTPLADRALLGDLARLASGSAPDPDGPLLRPGPCPGAHGLWQALAGRLPAPGAETDLDDAFAALPPDARLLFGPDLVSRLLGAGRVAEARGIRDLILRAGLPESLALRRAEAELLAADGRPSEAAALFRELAGAPVPDPAEALMRHARLTLLIGAPTRDLATDLAIAAHLSRGRAIRPELLALSAEALGQSGALAGALAALEAARAEFPAAAPRFAAAATSLLAKAPPDRPAPADWAALVLAHPGLIARTRAEVPAREAIARRLLEIGLPAAARDLAAPLLTGGPGEMGEREARLIAAEAELRLGHPESARALTRGLAGSDAATIRARAEAGSGAWSEAVRTLAAAGLEAEAAPYAFTGGDWSRARASADPAERAMAAYMGRAAPAPEATPAEAAFAARPPAPARPSLAAPRDLLDKGADVTGFIRALIARSETPAAP